nr:hypothetical protein [Proteus sp. CD3]
MDNAHRNRTQYRYNTNDQIVGTQYSNQFEHQSEKFQYDSNLNITEHQFISSINTVFGRFTSPMKLLPQPVINMENCIMW